MARHLTKELDEGICDADILRWALDGDLTLSVNLIHSHEAFCGSFVPSDGASPRRDDYPVVDEPTPVVGIPLYAAEAAWPVTQVVPLNLRQHEVRTG